MPGLHHLDIWIADPADLIDWTWLFTRLGWKTDATWPGGSTFSADGAYISVTTTPNTVDASHDRRRPGVNHLAFAGGTAGEVDALMAEAPSHGWRPLYADRYPHAGGAQHDAGWLENTAGFKVEVVAGQGFAGRGSAG